MPQSVGSIALDIVMGNNNVSDVVRQAMDECNKVVSDSASSISSKVKSVGDSVTKVGSALLPASTATAALGTAVVKTASDFDSSMSRVSAISGATGDELEQLRNKAKEMGSTTKFSASESAEAMQYMAMAGWKTGDMLNGIGGIMDLAAASGEDLATTSDIVTDALTAFGMTAEESGHFADILAVASSNANTNVSMMGETFKYVAPVAGAMGYSAEDMSVAIGLMANSGIKASQAGTALRSTISRLAKPTKESSEAMEALGLSVTNQDGSMKSFNEIMVQMREGMAGMTEDQKSSVAAMLGGQEAMSGLLAIANASDADFATLTNAINNCDGSAASMAATMQDNLNGKITTLKSQLEGVAIQLGEILVPIISDVVGHISNLVNWFSGLDEGTQKIIVGVGLVIAVLGPALIIIGKVISAVGTIIPIITGIATFITGTLIPVIGGFFTFLAANPIVLIIAAIVAAIALLVTHWEFVKEVATVCWKVICDKISEAGKFIGNILSGIGSFITNTWNNALKFTSNFGANILAAIVNTFTNMYNAVSNRISSIRTTIVDGFNSAIKFITSLPKQAVTWGKDMMQGIVNGIKAMIGKVKDAVGSVASTIKSFLHFSVPDEGPLTDYESWMPDFMQGLAKGINTSKHYVTDAIGSLAGDMALTPAFAVEAPQLRNVGSGENTGTTGGDKIEQLLDMLKQLLGDNPDIGGGGQGGNITIPVYLGNSLIDEYLVDRTTRRTVRSGGRA